MTVGNNKPLILIVDDVPGNIKVLASALVANYQLIISTSGKEALQLAEQQLPDLILLDIIMPELDGYEVCKKLKNNSITQDIPVIFVTAKGDEVDEAYGLNLGAVDYIVKPFSLSIVQARIATHIRLRQSQQKIDLQNKQLRELNAAKDKFFSIIAHDLKGPFVLLMNFSKMLVDVHFNEQDRQEIIGDMIAVSENGFDLLQNLLAWARSQTNSLEIRKQITDINQLILSNIEFFTVSARNKNIQLCHQLFHSTLINVDKNMVDTVIRNLTSNAIKFTPGYGIITLSTIIIEDEVEISISDTGIGMNQNDIENLFRVDVYHSTHGTNGEEGTGLGLLVCKEFVEKHGGRIWVHSKPNYGTTFYFTLPINT